MQKSKETRQTELQLNEADDHNHEIEMSQAEALI